VQGFGRGPDVPTAQRGPTASDCLLHGLGIVRAQPLVEAAGGSVRLERPEVDGGLGIVLVQPGGALAHELSSSAAALALWRDVEVVDQRSPLRVLGAVDADEPLEPGVVFGDDHSLVLRWSAQPGSPHEKTIFDYAMVEVVIGIDAAYAVRQLSAWRDAICSISLGVAGRRFMGMRCSGGRVSPAVAMSGSISWGSGVRRSD